jgi:hypothetical protein
MQLPGWLQCLQITTQQMQIFPLSPEEVT